MFAINNARRALEEQAAAFHGVTKRRNPARRMSMALENEVAKVMALIRSVKRQPPGAVPRPSGAPHGRSGERLGVTMNGQP